MKKVKHSKKERKVLSYQSENEEESEKDEEFLKKKRKKSKINYIDNNSSDNEIIKSKPVKEEKNKHKNKLINRRSRSKSSEKSIVNDELSENSEISEIKIHKKHKNDKKDKKDKKYKQNPLEESEEININKIEDSNDITIKTNRKKEKNIDTGIIQKEDNKHYNYYHDNTNCKNKQKQHKNDKKNKDKELTKLDEDNSISFLATNFSNSNTNINTNAKNINTHTDKYNTNSNNTTNNTNSTNNNTNRTQLKPVLNNKNTFYSNNNQSNNYNNRNNTNSYNNDGYDSDKEYHTHYDSSVFTAKNKTKYKENKNAVHDFANDLPLQKLIEVNFTLIPNYHIEDIYYLKENFSTLFEKNTRICFKLYELNEETGCPGVSNYKYGRIDSYNEATNYFLIRLEDNTVNLESLLSEYSNTEENQLSNIVQVQLKNLIEIHVENSDKILKADKVDKVNNEKDSDLNNNNENNNNNGNNIEINNENINKENNNENELNEKVVNELSNEGTKNNNYNGFEEKKGDSTESKAKLYELNKLNPVPKRDVFKKVIYPVIKRQININKKI